jgi:dihydrofolate reductase
MRKIVVLTFVSLDGVMQAPGGPEEDTSGGFTYGGWTHPYFDDFLGTVMGDQMSAPFDLLLGRKTYKIFSSFWPNQDDQTNPAAGVLNTATKYVVANTPVDLTWENSVHVKNPAITHLESLKHEDGPTIQVHGSSNLIQTLLKNDLVDELWLKIFPVTLGMGKRLFGEGTIPAAFKLTDQKVSPKGVIIANYRRSGSVHTGSFA